MFTDASNSGWGAQLNGQIVEGVWSVEQRQLHINVLEMLVVLLAMKHFLSVIRGRALLSSFRQLQGGCLFEESGWHPISSSVSGHSAISSERECQSISVTHPRQAKCPSRQLVQVGKGDIHGMVTSPVSWSVSIPAMGTSSDGSDCHQVQQQTSYVCISSTGSDGVESELSLISLGKSVFPLTILLPLVLEKVRLE